MAKPKKRRARRTRERIEREYQAKNYGETMKETIYRLRGTLSNRDKQVERLREEVRTLKENEGKAVRQMEVLKNREIRKRETIIRNQKKKLDKLVVRKRKRPSIVYRNRWKEFEPSSSVLSLKRSIENASQVTRRVTDIFEVLQKMGVFFEEFYKESGVRLSFGHFIVLAGMEMIGDVRGIFSTRVYVYGNSPHKTRKLYTDLVKAGLAEKYKNYYTINAMGKKFLDDLGNRVSYGASEVIKMLEEYDGD